MEINRVPKYGRKHDFAYEFGARLFCARTKLWDPFHDLSERGTYGKTNWTVPLKAAGLVKSDNRIVYISYLVRLLRRSP